MKRRARSIAGILALVALSLSLAESVLASTCPPMSEAEQTDMAGMMGGSPTDDAPDGDQSDDRHCPFSGAVPQGCFAFASLPAGSDASPAPALEGHPEVISGAAHPDLLLARALFRPPRA